MGHTSPMGPIPGGFYFGMFEIASDHGKVLSHRSSFTHDILIENEGGNQKQADPNERERKQDD